ncbi:hypothetical protein EDB83DRAFT_1245046 [Lactarius deliciosus]|nr:hypothetical protein EDB83DRAFT_1245046 [Lactarius deliciosus]
MCIDLFLTIALSCRVFAISCVILLAKYPNTLLYAPPFFILNRLYFCAFMSVLNSRDHLRETLDGQEGVITFSQLKERTGTTIPCAVQVTTGNEHHRGYQSSTGLSFLRHVDL